MDRLVNQTFRISTRPTPRYVVGDFKFLSPNYETTGTMVIGSSGRSVRRSSDSCREHCILFLDQPLSQNSQLFLKLEHKSTSITTGFGLFIGLTSCSVRSITTNECHAVSRCLPDNSCAGRSIVVRIACPVVPDVLRIEFKEDKFLISSRNESHIRTEPVPVFYKKLQTMARFAAKFTSIPFLLMSGDVTEVKIVDASHFIVPIVPQSAPPAAGPSIDSMFASSMMLVTQALEHFRHNANTGIRASVATPPTTRQPIAGPAADAPPVVPVTRPQPPVREVHQQQQQQHPQQQRPHQQTRTRVQAPDRAMRFQPLSQTAPPVRSAGPSGRRQRSVIFQNRNQTQRRTGNPLAAAPPVAPVQPPVTSNAADAANTSESTADTECVVCMDKKKVVICLPCRHICLCEECATRVWNSSSSSNNNRTDRLCPVCRGTIRQMHRVYW